MKLLPTLCVAAAAATLSVPAYAQVLTVGQQGYITVQPVFIRDNGGGNSAGPSDIIWDQFKTATQAIWDQAQITIVWNTPSYLDNSNYLDMGLEEANSLMGPLKGSSTIHLWIADSFSGGLAGSNGYSKQSSNSGGSAYTESGIVINNSIFSPTPKLDVIAHEIGHNLGLGHASFGAGSAKNLMTDGLSRTSLTDLANLTPNGSALAQLTGDLATVNVAGTQIWQARSSILVSAVPEPETYAALFGGGLFVLAAMREVYRRRASATAASSAR